MICSHAYYVFGSLSTHSYTAGQIFRAGYADCHSFLVMYADPKPGYRERARDASARAVELEPDLAEAHATAERVIRELRSRPFKYDSGTRSFWDDPLDPLLGRLELPRTEEEGEEGDW